MKSIQKSNPQPAAPEKQQSAAGGETIQEIGLPSHALIRRAHLAPARLSSHDVRTLQRTMGNRQVIQLMRNASQEPVIQRDDDMVRQYSGEKHMTETLKEATWRRKERFGLSSWERTSDYEKPAAQPKAFKEAEWQRDKEALLARVRRIGPLGENGDFINLIEAYIDILKSDGTGQGSGKANTQLADSIVGVLDAPNVRGFEVPYRWFASNQDKPDFDDLLQNKAQSASGQGRFWSKLYTRRSEKGAESAPDGGGVFLESSLAGVIFDGLDFGLPRWDSSPTMGYLWGKLSSTYADHLHGTVTADVLDGRDPTSVLSTLEWHRLREAIMAGRVKEFHVNIHEFRNNMFKVVKQIRIDKQNLTDWFGQVEEVPTTQKWKQHQRSVDTHEKLFARMDELFRDVDEAVKNGEKLVSVKSLK